MLQESHKCCKLYHMHSFSSNDSAASVPNTHFLYCSLTSSDLLSCRNLGLQKGLILLTMLPDQKSYSRSWAKAIDLISKSMWSEEKLLLSMWRRVLQNLQLGLEKYYAACSASLSGLRHVPCKKMTSSFCAWSRTFVKCNANLCCEANTQNTNLNTHAHIKHISLPQRGWT